MNSLKYNIYHNNFNHNTALASLSPLVACNFNSNNDYLILKSNFINIYQNIKKFIDIIPDNEKAFIKDLNLYDKNNITKNNYNQLVIIYNKIKYIIN